MGSGFEISVWKKWGANPLFLTFGRDGKLFKQIKDTYYK